MNFYQKYRPRKISELDLNSVREVLVSTLLSGKVAHAYLFVGPRGAGKTSAARILAQVVNCKKNIDKKTNLGEPCGECESCKAIIGGSGVDVMEIDAASNGLVDDIRDLREKVRLAPVQLFKKVYIIDEVHMVSTAGFNALLKTLEEPPSHALFILCTTEAQKVPETIVSRCAKINFTKGSVDEVVVSLKKAVTGEKLEVDEDALKEIALATDGSFREGHKLLEQLSAYDKRISVELVADTLGVFSRSAVNKLMMEVVSRDSQKVMSDFAEMEKAGTKANILLVSLLNCARSELERSVAEGKGQEMNTYLRIIDLLINAADKIKSSPLPLLPIEIALLNVCTDAGGVGLKPVSSEGGQSRPKVETPAQEITAVVSKTDTLIHPAVVKKVVESIEEVKEELSVNEGIYASFDKVKMEWGEFLNAMAVSNGSLAGMLRQSSPLELNGKNLTLSVVSRFQQDMLERDVKKKIIEEQMAKIWGPLTFKCVLKDSPVRTEITPEDANVTKIDTESATTKSVMMAAEEIFGN